MEQTRALHADLSRVERSGGAFAQALAVLSAVSSAASDLGVTDPVVVHFAAPKTLVLSAGEIVPDAARTRVDRELLLRGYDVRVIWKPRGRRPRIVQIRLDTNPDEVTTRALEHIMRDVRDGSRDADVRLLGFSTGSYIVIVLTTADGVERLKAQAEIGGFRVLGVSDPSEMPGTVISGSPAEQRALPMAAVSVVIYYSTKDYYRKPRDTELFDLICEYVAGLRATHKISVWHPGLIDFGTDWKRETDRAFRAARVVLPLVARNLMVELADSSPVNEALARMKTGQCTVVPILVHDAPIDGSGLALLKALPSNGTAISASRDKGRACSNVVAGVRQVLESLR
jgi:hypothetical protein